MAPLVPLLLGEKYNPLRLWNIALNFSAIRNSRLMLSEIFFIEQEAPFPIKKHKNKGLARFS